VGDALGKVRFEPQFLSIELWCQYHLVVVQSSCPTHLQLITDLRGAVPCYASMAFSGTELWTVWVTDEC